MNSRLFAANQRPAVDVGLSVSRVGGKAQHPALRQVSGRIRLDYSQFLELEMFTRFGGISDNRIKAQMTRGERIRTLLAQPRFASLRMIDQIGLIAALGAGALDEMPATDILALRARISSLIDRRAPEAARTMAAGKTLDDVQQRELVAAVRAVVAGSTTTDPETPL